MVVQLELLLGREMPPDTEVRGVLDQSPLERNVQSVVGEFARLQRHERVPAEQSGAYGRPLGHPRRVVEIHLVHGPDLGAVAVVRLAAYQAARIDIGLHGPSNWSHSSVSTTKVHICGVGHSKVPVKTSLVGWHRLSTPCGRVLRFSHRRRRRSKSSPESLRPLYRTDEVTLESRAGVDGIRSHRR